MRVQTPSGWGEFGPQNSEWLHIITDRGKIYNNKQIHINGQIATYGKDGIDDTRKLKSLSRIGGFAIDGGGTTMMLEGGTHKLYGGSKYDAWTNDRWDLVYIFKGWKFEAWEHADKDDNKLINNETNNTNYVKKIDLKKNNKASLCRLTWVGY